MTPEQSAAVDVVREEFGTPLELRFPEVWGPRAVVEAVLPERTVFLKATGDADVLAEASTMGLARAAGVPVPEILKTGTDSRVPGGRWMATAKAPGVSWPIDIPTNNDRTLRDVAWCFARLSAQQIDGFGPLTPDGKGTYPTWREWLQDSIEDYLDSLLAAGLTTDEFAAKARTAFATATPDIAKGALIHGDLGPGETFVDPGDGSVLCLVDWGSSVVGDPVYELARFIAGGPADNPTPAALLPIVIEHYVAGTGIDERYLAGVLPLYQAHNAIFNADWSYREAVPWVDGLLAQADVLLDRVLQRQPRL